MPDPDDLKLIRREAIPDDETCARYPDFPYAPLSDKLARAGMLCEEAFEEVIAASLEPDRCRASVMLDEIADLRFEFDRGRAGRTGFS